MRVRSDNSISTKIAHILGKLPKNHTRPEAYEAIRNSGLKDQMGEPLVPSVWYHQVCYVPRASGLPLINELYPKFKPAPSPYPRASKTVQVASRATGSVQVDKVQAVSALLTKIMEVLKVAKAELKEVTPKPAKAKPMVSAPGAIHASIHQEDSNIGRAQRALELISS